MFSGQSPTRLNWLLFGLAAFTFFFLLGGRGLNEPDEGRYAEIAREMVGTGDWLVPHIWHVPHLDKPPMTYWLVALSLKTFGVHEWAVRLPLALAGFGGALGVWRLARSMGGERVARWSVLILISSTLWFTMARMLTTDIFLALFVVWAIVGFWEGWRSLDGLTAQDEEVRVRAGRKFFRWHSAAWVCLAAGFLTKGPVALLFPLVALVALLIYRREDSARRSLVVLGLVTGFGFFAVVAFPWFLAVFQNVPQSFDFMVKGQLAAHALGAAAKNRGGSPFYFFAVLPLGFLPWIILLGWLWRRGHWRSLPPVQREGWVMLTAWAVFTFVFFTVNSAKLPAYILPMLPALAVLVALRWPAWENLELPAWARRIWLASSLLGLAGFALAARFVFGEREAGWIWVVLAAVAVVAVVLCFLANRLNGAATARCVVALGVVNLLTIAALAPGLETRLKSNQTLKPLGVALRDGFRPGDAVVCWGRFPQGLPFYAHPAIDSTNRPFLGGMPLHRIPFEFPGNPGRFGDRLLPDAAALEKLLRGSNRVWVVSFQGTLSSLHPPATNAPLRRVVQAGQWDLSVNR
ncbi:MAG: glycosyltransferase family 39 protein [Verrucomicrobia bacterium]|nr:glycosyltransferase family 39 protein [Verrucomicrobiota bacterium]